MGKRKKKDDGGFPWKEAMICATIICALGAIFFIVQKLSSSGRISNLEKEVKQAVEKQYECESDKRELDELFANEEKKTKKMEREYKEREIKRQAHVKKLLKNSTFTEKQLAPFYRMKKCVGNQCWMIKVNPK